MTFDAHILDGFNSFLLAAVNPAADAAAATKGATTPSGGGNIFDVFVMVMLIVGLIRGKKRGMSEELLDVFKWLLVVVVAARGYKLMGEWVANFANIPVLIAYVICYLFVVMVITGVFSTIKRKMGEKVFESDLFGKAEYPLGALAGMVRYGCTLLAMLAVLNAFDFNYDQIAISDKSQGDSMGMTLIPPKEAWHKGIFINSLTGQFVRKHLEDHMIEPTPYAANPGAKSELPSKERERAVDNAINGTPKK